MDDFFLFEFCQTTPKDLILKWAILIKLDIQHLKKVLEKHAIKLFFDISYRRATQEISH